MRILLDTHILIWFHTNAPELSEKAWRILLNPENDIYFSSINIWETQIKHLKTARACFKRCYEVFLPCGLRVLFILLRVKARSPMQSTPLLPEKADFVH